MAKKGETLSDLFRVPQPEEGSDALRLTAVGGVLCAYSADVRFLDYALTQFAASEQVRQRQTNVLLTLMLDPTMEHIRADHVSGLLHLKAKTKPLRPWAFKSMHAKVALLAFGPCRNGEPTAYRIIVSTGNWTAESAQSQIEMVWKLDVDADSPDEDLWELYLVTDFLNQLTSCYQTEPTMPHVKLLNGAMLFGKKPSNTRLTRFITSVKHPLFEEIAKVLKRRDVRKCNYLIFGSPFLSKCDDSDDETIIDSIRHIFEENDIITKRPEAKLVVNRNEQGLFRLLMNEQFKGMDLREAKDPAESGDQRRTRLHAKFLFMAKKRYDDLLSNCWLYFGSGNLTYRGMMLHHSNATSPGNIEAGVLIACDELGTTNTAIRRLPVGSSFAVTDAEVENDIEIQDESADDQPTPPIIQFRWEPGRLIVDWDADMEVAEPVQVFIDNACMTIAHDILSISLEQAPQARCLRIVYQGTEHWIPCIDLLGFYIGRPLPPMPFDMWMREFSAKDSYDPQNRRENEEDDTEDSDDTGNHSLTSRTAGNAGQESRNFPAHTAMSLVEKIAEENGRVSEEYAADWLLRLELSLSESIPAETIEEWRSLRINFMAPLLSRAGFAPDWENLDSYENVIHRITAKWGLSGFPMLEVPNECR